MQKLFARCVVLVSALMVSAASLAASGFNIPATATMVTAEEEQQQTEFAFAFEPGEYSHKFTAANVQFTVSDIPRHYTIALLKHGDNVSVPELSQSHLKSFALSLADYDISMQERMTLQGKKLVLSLNKFHYDFSGPYASIEISFKKDGVSSIKVKGLKRIKVV